MVYLWYTTHVYQRILTPRCVLVLLGLHLRCTCTEPALYAEVMYVVCSRAVGSHGNRLSGASDLEFFIGMIPATHCHARFAAMSHWPRRIRMLVKLFVGNLAWSVNDTTLEDAFADHGEVQSARVITDRDTGRSRGFGFVEIETENADAVIDAVNGRDINGRQVRVNRAEDKARSGGGGGGGGRDRRGPPRGRF